MKKECLILCFLWVMIVMGCSGGKTTQLKYSGDSSIRSQTTDETSESLQGVRDARRDAREDYKKASLRQKAKLLTGPPDRRLEDLSDKSDVYVNAYMNEYTQEIERQNEDQKKTSAVWMLLIGGVTLIVVAITGIGM